MEISGFGWIVILCIGLSIGNAIFHLGAPETDYHYCIKTCGFSQTAQSCESCLQISKDINKQGIEQVKE